MKKQFADLKVNYLAAGAGHPLIFLHGMGGRAQAFEEMIPRLANNFSVYAFDQRGSGTTERPPLPKLSFEVWRDDVLAFMDAMGIEKAALAGWSLGAETALHVALAAPERVTHIVMIGPGAGPGIASSDRSGFEARRKLILGGATQEEIVEKTFDFTIKSLSADTQKNKPEVIARIRKEHLSNNPLSYLEMIDASETRTSLDARLGEIACPTLIVCGDEDSRTPLIHSVAFNKAIEQSFLKVIRDCGHHYGLEQPEATSRVIARFIKAFEGNGHG